MSSPDVTPGLRPDQLASIGARFVPRGDETWASLPGRPFEGASLGLDEASGGLLRANRLRAVAGGEPAGMSTCDEDLQALYVVRGTVDVEVEGGGGPATLGPGDLIARTRGAVSRVIAGSPDFEGYAVSAAAGVDTGGSGVFVSLESPEAHVLGAGPRPDVIYRDLGTAAATAGAYRLQIVQASKPAENMAIWHFHDMAQWFVVLDGWARVEVNGLDPAVVRPGDALCVGAGREMRHNVSDIGEGFTILELCTPAEYQTWPAG